VWNSADLGAYLRFQLPAGLGQVSAGAFNGAGYKNALDTDSAKHLWAFANLTPLAPLGPVAERFTLAGFVSRGFNISAHSLKKLTWSGMLAYKDAWLTLAYQLVGNTNEAAAGDGDGGGAGADDVSGLGHAGYLKVGLPANLGLLGRFIIWDADVDSDDEVSKYQALGGLSWSPLAQFQVAASGLVTWYQGGNAEDETEPGVRLLLSSEFGF